MYEIDFLAVEADKTDKGSKSGDAIAVHFRELSDDEDFVVVVDAGFTDVGERLADFIVRWYDTDYVDLVISTHPDVDHLNGIKSVLEELTVKELMIHQPRKHFSNLRDFSNLEKVDEIIALAKSKGVTLTEPFTGESRFGGRLRVLGPTVEWYESEIERDMQKQRSERLGLSSMQNKSFSAFAGARDLLAKALDALPIETLTDEGDVSGRNNSSVITLFRLEGRRLMLTGDAGADALDPAADVYESVVGPFATYPLDLFQLPHHGSRRNVGPTILNRILGPKNATAKGEGYVSSAKADEKHPSPKVVNASRRRGYAVTSTEGSDKRHRHNAPSRPGWVKSIPLPPLQEDD